MNPRKDFMFPCALSIIIVIAFHFWSGNLNILAVSKACFVFWNSVFFFPLLCKWNFYGKLIKGCRQKKAFVIGAEGRGEELSVPVSWLFTSLCPSQVLCGSRSLGGPGRRDGVGVGHLPSTAWRAWAPSFPSPTQPGLWWNLGRAGLFILKTGLVRGRLFWVIFKWWRQVLPETECSGWFQNGEDRPCQKENVLADHTGTFFCPCLRPKGSFLEFSLRGLVELLEVTLTGVTAFSLQFEALSLATGRCWAMCQLSCSARNSGRGQCWVLCIHLLSFQLGAVSSLLKELLMFQFILHFTLSAFFLQLCLTSGVFYGHTII